VDSDIKGVAQIGSAAVLGAGAAYAAVALKKKRDSASVTDLYNSICDLPEPYMLSKETVAALEGKYGIKMAREELDGLQRIYGHYLETVIPKGDTQLTGGEAANVKQFKEVRVWGPLARAAAEEKMGRSAASRREVEEGREGWDLVGQVMTCPKPSLS
jgi:hypothetical protein